MRADLEPYDLYDDSPSRRYDPYDDEPVRFGASMPTPSAVDFGSNVVRWAVALERSLGGLQSISVEAERTRNYRARKRASCAKL